MILIHDCTPDTITLITLLRILYLCHFGSSGFVLTIRPKYGIFNRVIRVPFENCLATTALLLILDSTDCQFKQTTSFPQITFLNFWLADPVSFDIDSRLRCPRQQNRLRTAQQLLLASSTDLSPELMSCYGSLNVCPRLISKLWFSLKVRISQTQPFIRAFFFPAFTQLPAGHLFSGSQKNKGKEENGNKSVIFQ